MTEEESKQQGPYAYWLSRLQGIGRVGIAQLLKLAGTPKEAYYLEEIKLRQCLTEKKLAQWKLAKQSRHVYQEYEALEKQKIHFIFAGHPQYPRKLSCIPDAPYALYVKGSLPKEAQPSVAVIGTRMCSEYGRFMAKQFGKELAKAGVQVISGLARGVDGLSQKSAMEAGGESFGILGCGVDICYPSENRSIYEQTIRQGGILSEYAPGTKPQSINFPPRNRIISGLADVVLVIEAKAKSGTCITVDMALEQGKSVYALPGRVTDALSYGCNSLIEQGAGIVLSPEAFIRELSCLGLADKRQAGTLLPEVTAKKTSGILQFLDAAPYSVEEIYDKARKKEPALNIQTILQELLLLELEGKIVREGTSYYLPFQE